MKKTIIAIAIIFAISLSAVIIAKEKTTVIEENHEAGEVAEVLDIVSDMLERDFDQIYISKCDGKFHISGDFCEIEKD